MPDNDENRKATVPGMDLIAEIFRNTTRIEAGMGEMKRQNADDKMVIMQRISSLEQRVDTVETVGIGRVSETARKAMESYSDLSKQMQSNEAATKAAVDSIGRGLNSRMDKLEAVTNAQTPMLEKLETMLADQNAYEKAKERMKLEAAEAAAEKEREAQRAAAKAAADRAEKEHEEAIRKAEEDRTAAIQKAADDTRHRRRMAWAGVAISVLGIMVTALTTYLSTKQANQDAPPKTVVVHESH